MNMNYIFYKHMYIQNMFILYSKVNVDYICVQPTWGFIISDLLLSPEIAASATAAAHAAPEDGGDTVGGLGNPHSPPRET